MDGLVVGKVCAKSDGSQLEANKKLHRGARGAPFLSRHTHHASSGLNLPSTVALHAEMDAVTGGAHTPPRGGDTGPSSSCGGSGASPYVCTTCVWWWGTGGRGKSHVGVAGGGRPFANAAVVEAIATLSKTPRGPPCAFLLAPRHAAPCSCVHGGVAAWRAEGCVRLTDPPKKKKNAGARCKTATRPPPCSPPSLHPSPPQISRHDTLAGIAVRYGVSPADVRRANGLLSDSAMFARPTLLVPRGPPPPVE